MAETKRMGWVDHAKGISIILVVMLYAANSVGEATGGVGFLHYIIGFAMTFRMPEFFLISGLFLSLVIGRDWKPFLDRRVVHYLYFYGLWALILIVFKKAIFAGDPALALNWIGWAVIDPYSMLWFIYVLAFFGLAAKIAHALKIPHWAMLAGAAALQIAPIDTASYAVDYFSEYLVYFYSGYVFAPYIFKLVNWFLERPLAIVGTLAVWAVFNGFMVFFPSFKAMPGHFEMGYAALPGVHLAMALLGALAVCISAALVSRFDWMNWLRWMGQHSIVVYLGFSLPRQPRSAAAHRNTERYRPAVAGGDAGRHRFSAHSLLDCAKNRLGQVFVRTPGLGPYCGHAGFAGAKTGSKPGCGGID